MSSLVCYKSRFDTDPQPVRTYYKFYKTRACSIASRDIIRTDYSRVKRRQLWMRFFVIALAERKLTSGVRKISPEVGSGGPFEHRSCRFAARFGPREARITFVASEYFRRMLRKKKTFVDFFRKNLLLFSTLLDIGQPLMNCIWKRKI